MKAVVYEGPNKVVYKDVADPVLQEGWVRVKVKYAGICGSDLNIFYGTHPRAKAPLIMGHENVGMLDCGKRVTFSPLLTCGQCVPCETGNSHVCNTLRLLGIDKDGGFAEYCAVPAESIIPIPDGVSDKQAALVEPVAVAVHALRETNFVPGDNAVVVGCGPIGLCVALTLRLFGASSVLLMETDKKRAALAQEMGFEVVDPTQASLEEYCFDWVFDCAGAQPAADMLFDLVKVKGNVVIVAAYKKPASLPLIKGMFKELNVSFVRVYRQKAFEVAVDIVSKDPCFEKIITHVLPLSQGVEGFDLVTNPGTGAVKVLLEV